MKKYARIFLFIIALFTGCEIEAQYSVTDSCNALIITYGSQKRVYPKTELTLSYTLHSVLSLTRVTQSTVVASWTLTTVPNIDSLYHRIAGYLSYGCVNIQCSGSNPNLQQVMDNSNVLTHNNSIQINQNIFSITGAGNSYIGWNVHDSLTDAAYTDYINAAIAAVAADTSSPDTSGQTAAIAVVAYSRYNIGVGVSGRSGGGIGLVLGGAGDTVSGLGTYITGQGTTGIAISGQGAIGQADILLSPQNGAIVIRNLPSDNAAAFLYGQDTLGHMVQVKTASLSLYLDFSAIPAYASDAAADADTKLSSGRLYRLTTSRTLSVKP